VEIYTCLRELHRNPPLKDSAQQPNLRVQPLPLSHRCRILAYYPTE